MRDTRLKFLMFAIESNSDPGGRINAGTIIPFFKQRIKISPFSYPIHIS